MGPPRVASCNSCCSSWPALRSSSTRRAYVSSSLGWKSGEEQDAPAFSPPPKYTFRRCEGPSGVRGLRRQPSLNASPRARLTAGLAGKKERLLLLLLLPLLLLPSISSISSTSSLSVRPRACLVLVRPRGGVSKRGLSGLLASSDCFRTDSTALRRKAPALFLLAALSVLSPPFLSLLPHLLLVAAHMGVLGAVAAAITGVEGSVSFGETERVLHATTRSSGVTDRVREHNGVEPSPGSAVPAEAAGSSVFFVVLVLLCFCARSRFALTTCVRRRLRSRCAMSRLDVACRLASVLCVVVFTDARTGRLLSLAIAALVQPRF